MSITSVIFSFGSPWEKAKRGINPFFVQRLNCHSSTLSQRSVSFLRCDSIWSWRLSVSTSTEKTAASSGSLQAMNASLECSFASSTSLSPYCWSSFLSARDDRAQRSAMLFTPCRTLSKLLPVTIPPGSAAHMGGSRHYEVSGSCDTW